MSDYSDLDFNDREAKAAAKAEARAAEDDGDPTKMDAFREARKAFRQAQRAARQG